MSYIGERLKRVSISKATSRIVKVTSHSGEGYESRWGKGRPAPISSFGAGQGDNNISRLFEDEKDQLQFHPLEAGRVFFSSAVAPDVWSGGTCFLLQE